MKQEDCKPETRRTIRFTVINRKGNVGAVGNYRPICTLPALYKLFSTIMCNRLYNRLDQAQSEDRGGFGRSYQTLDHLATYRLLEQKCREWGIKMWVTTVDFMKAFHSTQKGTVSTDKERDMFEIKRGTKQEDPLSSYSSTRYSKWH